MLSCLGNNYILLLGKTLYRSGLKYLVCLNYFNRSVNFKNFKNNYRIRIFFVYVHV